MVVDIDRDFQISILDQGLLIHWNRLSDCVAVGFDKVDFLIQDGLVPGIQFNNFSPSEFAAFLSHASRAK